MKQKIDILCYYDNLYESLYDIFFYPSYKQYLSENFNLISHKVNVDQTTKTGWNTAYWSKILIDRFDFLKDYIIHNPNKWCIFSDIDILFLNNFYTDIQPLINEKTNDIYYMAEYIRAPTSEINGGFFLFYSNETVFNFFDLIQKLTTEMNTPNDQIVITKTFKNKDYDIKHSVLPRNSFVTNNNPRQKTQNLIKYHTLKVFHSTCSNTVMEKIQILSSIYLKQYGITGHNLWLPQDN